MEILARKGFWLTTGQSCDWTSTNEITYLNAYGKIGENWPVGNKTPEREIRVHRSYNVRCTQQRKPRSSGRCSPVVQIWFVRPNYWIRLTLLQLTSTATINTHYGNVTWALMCFNWQATWLSVQLIVQANKKANIKASHHWSRWIHRWKVHPSDSDTEWNSTQHQSWRGTESVDKWHAS